MVSNDAVPPGAVRVVLSSDYSGLGSGLGGSALGAASRSIDEVSEILAPSPILTAGSNDPQCVN